MKNLILTLLISIFLGAHPARASANLAEDTLTIISAVNAIGTAADAKDWKKCLDQFANEVFVDYSALNQVPGASVKAKDLVSSWEKLLGPVHLTQHMITNHEVFITGDEAIVRSYVSALHSHPVKSGEDYWLLLGKYEHHLHREKQGWKVNYLKLIPTYQAGNRKLLELISK